MLTLQTLFIGLFPVYNTRQITLTSVSLSNHKCEKLTAVQFEGHFKNRTGRERLHFQILLEDEICTAKGMDL